jgi:hypothetical protein
MAHFLAEITNIIGVIIYLHFKAARLRIFTLSHIQQHLHVHIITLQAFAIRSSTVTTW